MINFKWIILQKVKRVKSIKLYIGINFVNFINLYQIKLEFRSEKITKENGGKYLGVRGLFARLKDFLVDDILKEKFTFL